MPETYYHKQLYPFQDSILKVVEKANLDFYLTGGTALGRCYLHHRYSDDLDFFVNDHKAFKQQSSAAVNAIKRKWRCDIATASDTFVRLFIEQGELVLKIDFVNDVPAHYGEIKPFPLFHRVDSWCNILSNKLCAITRSEAKDVADILFLARKYAFEWEKIINEARQKDLWVDPLKICKRIRHFPVALFQKIKWMQPVDPQTLVPDLETLHNDIFFGASNSLAG